jgi:ribosomal-protein-alanine N-acetyltransferase
VPHPTLTTARLLLRPWRDEDLPAHAEMNADPRVMEFFPSTVARAESNARVARYREHFDRHGFGMWAVEVPGEAPFVGFVGLAHVPFESHFTPAVETGWRLAREHWGRGYATEAARAARGFAFGPLGLDQVVAFTAPANVRSRAVMERLGMAHDPGGEFHHPLVPREHPLSRCVLYRIARGAWEAKRR